MGTADRQRYPNVSLIRNFGRFSPRCRKERQILPHMIMFFMSQVQISSSNRTLSFDITAALTDAV
jgi:hypothetical protein